MARTGNSFAPGGKPIEPGEDQHMRRVTLSAENSTRKRPQSATNTQRNMFESNYNSRQMNSKKEKPIQIRLNKKVVKCLNQSKWTKIWFENAYIDNSPQLDKVMNNEPVAESIMPSSLAADSDLQKATTFS